MDGRALALARGSRKLHYFHPIRMENVVRSALGLVKHLLPVSAGNVFPVVPRLPDIPSFLDDLLTVLGGEAISPASPESPVADASGKAGNTSAAVAYRNDDKIQSPLVWLLA